MAIAELPPQSARRDPDPAGLRFERYFTQAGVHPYDAIQWELRDAVIPGDGGNVFEQKGVDHFANAAPLRRIGDDQDLKGAALLFVSNAGKHITGQILAVDGGVSAV